MLCTGSGGKDTGKAGDPPGPRSDLFFKQFALKILLDPTGNNSSIVTALMISSFLLYA